MRDRSKTWLAGFKKRVAGEGSWLYILSAVGLPFLVLACLVAVFGVNVPILDQWELVDLFKKYHSGELGFGDFFAQHNEHRLLFPRLIMFSLAVVSHWNIAWEMAASLLIAALVILYKIIELKPERTVSRMVAGALLLLMGLVLLNCAKGVVQMRNYAGQTRQAKHCAQHASKMTDQCLYKLYPLPDVTWQRLQYLRNLHWAGL